MKSVFIVNGGYAPEALSVAKMFHDEGWKPLNWIVPIPPIGIDLVCFVGGEDVSPELYGEENTDSYCNPKRDEFEQKIYKYCLHQNLPMVGICRGGQFLNVMNGGKMIQHLGHTYSGDIPLDVDWDYLRVRVDHHQGILVKGESVDAPFVPNDDVKVIARYMSTLGHNDQHDSLSVVCYYHKTRSLCFQPHPEWGHEPTKNLFFDLIKEYIFP
ncbi:MAG: gamma-glutamyl-gamma-aminobutyrate hydrolase family protein [Candidatus Obscuribacterales bacterium]